ncbi:MAG: ABC transporter ATP-binding protein [Burkholderiales bacterium]|nr:ABC transporter ATP-binding protein [Burkholderiales bacterium]
MNNSHLDPNGIIVSTNELFKVFIQGNAELKILTGVNLNVSIGETVSITGSSGSGKSTLLHLLAGLDRATSGEILVNGNNFTKLNDNQICQIRNQHLGFIYQFHHLLPEFTALENVLMPIMISRRVELSDKNQAIELLARMGLYNRTTHYPGQLSGGERQRVAIARAVINNPLVVFADEPTGNLDNYTSNTVLEIFFNLQQELKTSLIMVTHDNEVAAKTQTKYKLHNGILTLAENN